MPLCLAITPFPDHPPVFPYPQTSGSSLQRQHLLFEFKVVETTPADATKTQLQIRRYADKYRNDTQPIWLIGVEFCKDARKVFAFEVERG